MSNRGLWVAILSGVARRGGRGKPAPAKGGDSGRRPKKSVEQLDAEMTVGCAAVGTLQASFAADFHIGWAFRSTSRRPRRSVLRDCFTLFRSFLAACNETW
jgi:hypothetical protein